MKATDDALLQTSHYAQENDYSNPTMYLIASYKYYKKSKSSSSCSKVIQIRNILYITMHEIK